MPNMPKKLLPPASPPTSFPPASTASANLPASLDRHANKLREQNLSNLFGETAFEKVHCLDTGADKDEALLPYLDSGCVWVEDKIKNAELGDRLGMSAVLMKHDHQNDYTNDAIPAVESWKEIYEMLS